MTDRVVTSGAARLAVETHGEGTPVVLLHAGVTDRRVWAATIGHLPPGLRAVAYDRRGFGGTTYTPEEFSHLDDLSAVLASCADGPAILVGSSLGGALALDYALDHPGQVGALVLVGTAVTGAPAPQALPPHVQRISDLIDAAEEAGDGDAVNRLEARLWLDGPAAAEGRVGGEARELFLTMNAVALAAEDPGPERPRPPALPRLDALAIPLTIVVGDLDLPHVVERAHELHERVPRSRLVRIEDTAHLPQLEHPDVLAGVVAETAQQASLPARP